MRLLSSLSFLLLVGCGTAASPGLQHGFAAGASQASSPRAEALAHYLAALIHQRNGRYEEYVEELTQAARLAPESTGILARLGEAHMRRQDYAKARDAYARAVRQSPDDAVLWIWLGVAHQQLNEYEKAAEAFTKAINLAPDNPLGYQALIEAETRANDYVAAVELYQKLVQLRPDSAELRMHLGGSLARIRDIEGARQAFEEAVQLDPKLHRARFALGFVLLDLDAHERAAQEFRTYLLDNPDDPDAMEGLAGAYARMGRYDEALALIDRLIDDDLAEAVHHLDRMYLLLEAGRAGEAAAAIPPNEAPLFGTLLRALARRAAGEPYQTVVESLDEADGNLEMESREYLAELLSLFGEDRAGAFLVRELRSLRDEGVRSKVVDFILGRTLMVLKRYEDAAQVLAEAAQNYPPDKWVYYELAGAYEHLDNFPEAERYLKQCLALDSSDPEIMNFLGYLYAEEGVKLDEAEELLKKALDMDPENPFYLDSLGWVYYRKGEAALALDYIQRAIFAMEGDDAVLRDHLGDTYLLQGDVNRAIAEWQRARRLDPELEGVQEKLDKHSPKRTVTSE